MSRQPSRTFRLSLLAVGLLGSGIALAEARIDTQLAQKIAAAAPTDQLQVVITFDQSTPMSAAQAAALKAIGIDRGISMRTLPIAGALATPSEIAALAQRDDVASVYFNAPLRYMNKEAREISGAARVVENQADWGQALPYSGRGVTVLVNDSGVDGTHEDLKFGENLVQNVLGPQNILAELAGELVGPGIVPVTYGEGIPNTDLGSGHGTHCAGTVGGTGERSGGLYRGVAPGADLVGYGSGAVILVLDAVGGLDYAATHQFSFDEPIRVTSNSWGSSGPFDPSNPVNIATYELYKRGIVSVFAAGNDGPGEDTHNPYAQAPWVISVGAGEKDGVLTSFSSRGKRGESGTFTMPDGRSWTYFNEPTIVATGVDIVSTRTVTGALPPLVAEQDATFLAPAHVPFYTHMSGTSMATPHVAGIIALMLEANPHLTPAQVKAILEDTATNMTGRLEWEAGAGHVNAYAAIAQSLGLRKYGATVNALRTFNANAQVADGGGQPFSVFFSPVGEPEYQEFEVAADVSWVAARATSDYSTVAIVLTDPDGVRYGSAIALPELGSTVTTGAPGKPGTWKISVSGIGSVSGVAVDPLRVTNGVAAPAQIDGDITFLKSAGYTGLADIGGHPARSAIEFAVANRLVDGYSDGKFRPDNALLRSELAQYLVMGTSVRQALPLNGVASFSDVNKTAAAYPYAESAIARGAPLRDLGQQQAGVMSLVNGKFLPTTAVTRVSLAYSLVQAQGLQAQATAFTGPVTALYNGVRVPVKDEASIPAPLRGYAQYALDNGLLNARFAVQQGPFDLQPTIVAYFDPNTTVTRGAYAVAAGRYLAAYQAAED